jgi:SAM-dependent methyltransferase
VILRKGNPFDGKKMLVCHATDDEAKAFLRDAAEVVNFDVRPLDYTDVTMDIQNMRPFFSESVDVFCALHVLNHVKDDVAAIKEIARILKPDGVMVVTVPYRENEKTELLEDITQTYGAEALAKYGVGSYRRYGLDDFIAILQPFFEVATEIGCDPVTDVKSSVFVCRKKVTSRGHKSSSNMRANACIRPFGLLPLGEKRAPEDSKHATIHNLIVTRYFLDLYGPKNPVVDVEDWFRKRERHFNALTFQSIRNQGVGNLSWVILVENKYAHLLPGTLREEECSSFVEIVAWNSEELNGATLSGYVNDKVNILFEDSSECDTVTVTRIDNDDALASDYISTLNRVSQIIKTNTAYKATLKNNPIITFPFGIQASKDQGCNAYIFNNNHFLSSVHFRDVHNTAYANPYTYNHTYIFDKHEPVLLLNTDRPMWLEAIHDHNIYNWFREANILSLDKNLQRRFPLNAFVD